MAKINKNYANLKESYLFADIAKRVNKFSENNPDKKVIKMGIGDVTKPLVAEVVLSMHSAVEDMGVKEGFHGYGPEQGYDFLKNKIVNYYKKETGVVLESNEVFISDGAKSDVGNITDLFSNDNVIVVPDPVYPVYVDSNIMLGRKIVYIKGNEENNFLPMPKENMEGDIFYLCSPNNPTGAAYSSKQLKVWVDFVNARQGIILYDAAYESFVKENLPRSIFEIEGAKKCAIEFCSFSKTAGFTGTRCGYTIVPNDLIREGTSINKMWLRRQTTKFNGVCYVVQKAPKRYLAIKGLSTLGKLLHTIKTMQKLLLKLSMRLVFGIQAV